MITSGGAGGYCPRVLHTFRLASYNNSITILLIEELVEADRARTWGRTALAIDVVLLLPWRRRSGHAFPLCPDRVLERQLPKVSYLYLSCSAGQFPPEHYL